MPTGHLASTWRDIVDSAKLEILHEHYRDTCSLQSGMLRSRDQHFLLIVALLAVMLFDMATPEGFDSAVGDLLKEGVGLSGAPNLDFVRSLLWFLLFGATVRYGQMGVNSERLYKSVHALEAMLDTELPGVFEREGRAYKRFKPPFVTWARVVYTVVFPLLLAGVVCLWLWWQSSEGVAAWPIRQWFNAGCAVAILVTVGMFLHAFHWYEPVADATHVEAASADAGGQPRHTDDNQAAHAVPSAPVVPPPDSPKAQGAETQP